MRQPTRVRLQPALPGELHLDAVIAVGRQHLAVQPDHERGLRVRRGRLAHEHRHHGRSRRHAGKPIEVSAALQIGQAQQLGGLRAEVVGGVVLGRDGRVAP